MYGMYNINTSCLLYNGEKSNYLSCEIDVHQGENL